MFCARSCVARLTFLNIARKQTYLEHVYGWLRCRHISEPSSDIHILVHFNDVYLFQNIFNVPRRSATCLYWTNSTCAVFSIQSWKMHLSANTHDRQRTLSQRRDRAKRYYKEMRCRPAPLYHTSTLQYYWFHNQFICRLPTYISIYTILIVFIYA